MMRPGRDLLWLGTIAVVAIGVRLVAINQPFVDPWSWRQSDVAAISRNYLHNGFHFAYPQIDWSGTAAGYVGTEFPILPFAAAICYKMVGVHEWLGRAQSLLFFGLSVPFFGALVRQTYGKVESTWALLFYCFAPLSIMTSRCFMPDMPSLSLSIIGLYCFTRWTTTQKRPLFVGAAIATGFSLLIKLPTAVIGAPLACAAIEKFGASAIRRPVLWLFGALVLIPSVLWYWHAADIAIRYYPHHFFGEGGIRLMSLNWYRDIALRTSAASLTPLLCAITAAGMFLASRRDQSSLFYWWLGAMILFVLVAGYGNRHPWYQLPLVPIAAAFGGCAMARLSRQLQPWPRIRLTATILIVSVFAVQSYAATRAFWQPAAADLRALGVALKQQTPAGALIVVADYGDPTALYYAERKGWHFLEKDSIYNGHPATSADAIEDLRRLRQQGAGYIAFYSGTLWWLDYYSEFNRYLTESSTLVQETREYEIFQLNH